MNKLFFTTVMAIFISLQIFGQPNYFIELRNGERLETYNIIYRTPLFKRPRFEVNDREIELFQVNKVFYQHGYYVAREIPGARNSTLLNIETEGPISIFYQFRSNTTYDPYTGFVQTNNRRTYYFEKMPYAVERLNIRNISVAVSDYQPSLEFAIKARNMNYITNLGYVASAAMIIGGFSRATVDPNTGRVKIPAITYVGFGTLIIPLVTGSRKDYFMNKAILSYNQARRKD